MGILDQYCTCPTCLERTKQALQNARSRWKNNERNIVFKPYHYTCGDGCCDDYGTIAFINEFQITDDGENIESVISNIMEFLEIDNVDINYDDEE